MQSKHKQTKCEHSRRKSYRLYSFLSRYHYTKSKNYLKRRYRIRHWIPMLIGTPCTIALLSLQHQIKNIQNRKIEFRSSLKRLIIFVYQHHLNHSAYFHPWIDYKVFTGGLELNYLAVCTCLSVRLRQLTDIGY